MNMILPSIFYTVITSLKKRTAICLVAGVLILLSACTNGQTPPSTAVATTTPVPTTMPTATPYPYEAIPGVYLGLFNGQGASSAEMFAEIGKGAAINAAYIQFKSPFVPGTAQSLARNDQISFLTWEYFGMVNTGDGIRPLDRIIEGEFDDHLQTWGQRLHDFGKPIFIRWGHEMNGDWYPWGGANNGGGTLDEFGDPELPDGPERFVAAYRHIHDIISAQGADNVLWVWCPNASFANMATSYGSTAGGWNEAVNYYPGDEYVDWLCFDGYNWGTSAYGQAFGSSWQSFDQIFASSYAELQALNPGKPIIIGEYASTEDGGDKAAWITDTYQKIQAEYPQIRAVIWFNTNKETDWRINSSPESLAAFKQAVADDYWLDKWPGLQD